MSDLLPLATRRIVKNMSMLLGSSLFAALCGLATLGLNSRALGPVDFGVLVIIQAFTALISGFLTFESWQPVIRFGLRMPHRLDLILACGMLLDLGASIAATLLAITLALGFGSLIGVDTEHLPLLIIYSLSLLAGLAGTPKGYFRLKNRFDVLAGNQMALAMTLAIAALILWFSEAKLIAYIITFAVIGATYNLSIFLRMLLHLKHEALHLRNPLTSRQRRRFFGIFVRAATSSSLLGTLKSVHQHAAILVVGSMAGGAASGLFAIASRLVNAASRVTQLFNQVLFSEILKASDEMARTQWSRMITRGTLISAAFCTMAAIIGAFLAEPLIGLIGGVAFVAAAPIFTLLFAAECINLASIHLNPVIQSRHGPKPLVKIALISTAIYLPSIWYLTEWAGPSGTAFGVLLAAAIGYGLMLLHSLRLLRQP